MRPVGTFLLLDGNSLVFRAWFALADAGLRTSAGQQTQAVFGFTTMLARLLQDFRPDGLAVAFDRPEPTFRDSIVADYKAGRAEAPEPLLEQLGLVRELVGALGVPALELPGYEADDLIATLATRLEAEGADVVVVTGDRDAFQLVRDPHVKVLYNRRGVTDYVLYDEGKILERTGVPPSRYATYAALRGDPSDNLPGVPGVGEKTAARLVQSYGDLDGIYAHLDELPDRLRAALAEHEEQVRRNLAATVLVRDAPIEVSSASLRLDHCDRAALRQLLDLLELRTPGARLLAALDALGSGAPLEAEVPTSAPLQVLSPGDPPAAAAALAALGSPPGARVALEPRWAGEPGRSALRALALVRASRDGSPALPPAPSGGSPSPSAVVSSPTAVVLDGALLEEPSVLDALARLVGGREPCLVGFRAKELMRALLGRGVDVRALDLDCAIAGYLLDPSRGTDDLEDLARARGLSGPAAVADGARVQLRLDVPAGDGHGGGVGTEEAAAAAGRAALAAALAPVLEAELAAAELRPLYEAVERPLVRVLARMEHVGVAVDVPALERLNAEMAEEAAALAERVQEQAGERFNVNSTPQLREVLFGHLKLPAQRRTKTGYSTDAQTLEKLRGAHPVVDTLLRYREVEKLRSTYGEGLLAEVAPDGRIHASFNQTVARTGRLSSDHPNLHNIPVRSEEGRRVRACFVAAPDFELFAADYDQIELRVIAHLSGDPGLVEAFRTGVDIHRETATRVFGVEPSQVTPAMRARAKMVSYGLAYGMEAYGLAQRLGIEVEEAQAILDQYFAAFPKVKEFMERAVREARERGYTETDVPFRRRRYLPDLLSPNPRVRQAAERQAMNAGIQGLAADIFKVALVRLDEELERGGYESRLVLQVHDEVLLEVAAEERDAVRDLTVSVMTGAAELRVPLAVHGAFGRTWADAKGG